MHFLKQFYIAIILIFIGLGLALFFYYFQPRPDQSSTEINDCNSAETQYCQI